MKVGFYVENDSVAIREHFEYTGCDKIFEGKDSLKECLSFLREHEDSLLIYSVLNIDLTKSDLVEFLTHFCRNSVKLEMVHEHVTFTPDQKMLLRELDYIDKQVKYIRRQHPDGRKNNSGRPKGSVKKVTELCICKMYKNGETWSVIESGCSTTRGTIKATIDRNNLKRRNKKRS